MPITGTHLSLLCYLLGLASLIGLLEFLVKQFLAIVSEALFHLTSFVVWLGNRAGGKTSVMRFFLAALGEKRISLGCGTVNLQPGEVTPCAAWWVCEVTCRKVRSEALASGQAVEREISGQYRMGHMDAEQYDIERMYLWFRMAFLRPLRNPMGPFLQPLTFFSGPPGFPAHIHGLTGNERIIYAK